MSPKDKGTEEAVPEAFLTSLEQFYREREEYDKAKEKLWKYIPEEPMSSIPEPPAQQPWWETEMQKDMNAVFGEPEDLQAQMGQFFETFQSMKQAEDAEEAMKTIPAELGQEVSGQNKTISASDSAGSKKSKKQGNAKLSAPSSSTDTAKSASKSNKTPWRVEDDWNDDILVDFVQGRQALRVPPGLHFPR